MTPNTRRKLQ